MEISSDKWNLLENAHDYRAQLRLLGFVLLADIVLVLSTGTNAWNLRWSTISDRPAAIVLVLIAYGAVVKVVVPLVLPILLSFLITFVGWIQRIPALSPKLRQLNSLTHVSWTNASEWLEEAPDGARRANVEKQMAEIRAEEARWHSTEWAGWTATLLVLISWHVPGTTIDAIAHWQQWSPWVVALFPAIPGAYTLWSGSPIRGEIYMPELARRLYKKRYPSQFG